ncbi:MAG TPA: hypothetical protein VH333_06100 [Pseudonocardiaceae bacterium]|jgi:hypothetical protein|nr:hypothetical protein [Pseudonocardiaceae bacterium]
MKPADVRAAVLQRLAMLDQLAVHGPTESQLPLARTELHRLADGWRTLLAVHQPGPDGRCRACPARLRRRRWPCRLWKTAYQHLIGDSENLTTRHRLRHRRHGR